MDDPCALERPMKRLAILLLLLAAILLLPAGLSAAQATLTRISVSASGQQGNNTSWGGVTISADGRYVAFTSLASNLVAGDTNNRQGCVLVGSGDRNAAADQRLLGGRARQWR